VSTPSPARGAPLEEVLEQARVVCESDPSRWSALEKLFAETLREMEQVQNALPAGPEAAERENERLKRIEEAAREVRDCLSREKEATGTRRDRALLRLDYAITLADNQRAALTPAPPASEDPAWKVQKGC
jgi:predicted ribosome quality control (RQC) complex YloA/Tae2 family protein